MRGPNWKKHIREALQLFELRLGENAFYLARCSCGAFLLSQSEHVFFLDETLTNEGLLLAAGLEEFLFFWLLRHEQDLVYFVQLPQPVFERFYGAVILQTD